MPHLRSFKVVVFFFLLAILDQTVLSAFRIGKVYPSFLYLFVCYAAIEWETKKTLPVAFWAGLLKDLFGGGPLGLEAAIMVIVAAGLDQIVRKIERGFPGIYFLLTFSFVLVCETLSWMLFALMGGGTGAILENFGDILGMAFYTALLLPVFDLFADFWFGSRSFSKQYELFK